MSLNIRLISVGKIREKHFRNGMDEYLKRIRPYMPISLVEGLEVKTSPRARQSELEEARRKEGERILALLKGDEILVAFDSRGQRLTSEELAALVACLVQSGKARLNLVVGGSTGLSGLVTQQADHIISLSPLTFPHQMAALIVAEQLYRAFTILKSHPYHK